LDTDVQNQHPEEALGQTPEVTPEIQNEAIDRPLDQVDGTYQEPVGEEPVEDPDAWRNIRIPSDPHELYEVITSLSEKDETFKRMLGTIAGRGTSAKLRQENAELAAKLEASEEAKRLLALENGNIAWGKMNQQQVADHLARRPQDIARWNAYNQMRQEAQQPQQRAPEWLRNMVVDAQSYVEQVAPFLPPQEEERIRALVTSQDTYRAYLNNPHQMMSDLQEAVAPFLQRGNNAGVQAGTTPRLPAPANGGTGSRTVLAGNPAIGSRTPDQTPPRRTSGGQQKYTHAEIKNMGLAQYEALLKQHGALTKQGLIDAGVVV